MEPAAPKVVRLLMKETVPLRQRVLRPGQTQDSVSNADDPTAVQMVVLDADGTPLACSNILPALAPWTGAPEMPDAPTGPAWRVRGVATDDAHRRQGLARACVRACEAAATDAGAALVWCNARLSAQHFYTALGWQQWGPVFGLGAIGPHVVMWRALP